MGRFLPLLLGVALALCIGAAVAQVPDGCDCTDNAPDETYTCADQKDFGKCEESWMIDGNLCEYTCGVCTCDDDASADAVSEEPESVDEEGEDAEEENVADADEEDDEADTEVDAEVDADEEADEEVDEDAEADEEVDEDEEAGADEDEVAVEEDDEEEDADTEEEDAEDAPVVTLGDDEEDEDLALDDNGEDEEDTDAEDEDAEEEDEDAEEVEADPEDPTEDAEEVEADLEDPAEDAEEVETDPAEDATDDTEEVETDPAEDAEAAPLVQEVATPGGDTVEAEVGAEDPVEEAEEEDTTEEEDDVDAGDKQPLEEFADPKASCGSTVYEALNGAQETGSFATLLAAAGLDADLGSEDAYTVFAPTNEAVEDGVGALGISEDDLLSSPKVETISKYHIIEGLLEPADLKKPREIETLSGDAVIGGSVREIEGIGSSGRFIGDPIPICNSLVYLLDDVLLPAGDLASISPEDVAPAPEEEAEEAKCEEGFDGFFAISEDQELSILTEMLNTFSMSADLADGAVKYTIFAPTNDAFQKAAKALDTTVSDMLKDENTKGILEYHIIEDVLEAKDLLEEKSTDLTSQNGTKIVMETNAQGTEAELFGIGSSAKVIETDIDKSCTASVHKVNNVLLPFRPASSSAGVRGVSSPTKAARSAPASKTSRAPAKAGACEVGNQSLFEVLGQIPEISVFASIVSQAKLAKVFTNKALKVTVFAPMDFAFGNILPRGKGFFDLVPDEILAENLVSNHIVGKPLPSRRLTDGLKLKTALTNKGKPETLEVVEDDLVFPTGLKIEAAESTGNFTKLDIFACNSVIHLIDGVLIADPDVIPSKTVTAVQALEASEPFASLLNPRDSDKDEEDEDSVTSG